MPYPGRGLTVAVRGRAFITTQGSLNAVAGFVVREKGKAGGRALIVAASLEQDTFWADFLVSHHPEGDSYGTSATEVYRRNVYIIFISVIS